MSLPLQGGYSYINDVGRIRLKAGPWTTTKAGTSGSILQVLHNGGAVVNGAPRNGLSHALPIINNPS